VSGGVPHEESQVEATDGWASGGAAGEHPGPQPTGEDLTAGTIFAPGLVQEATTVPRGSAATPQGGASEQAAGGPDPFGPAEE
jgi:hypothetical protein